MNTTKSSTASSTSGLLRTFLIAFASFVLFIGLATTTYFLVKQSLEMNTLKNEKADQSTVYDRTTVDQKIPSSGGIPGPSGPKGDPGSIGVELLITNDYSFTKFAQISDYTPVNLLFSSDFKLSQYAAKMFIGWIVSSYDQDKLLIGRLYDLKNNNFLANYRLTTSLVFVNGVSNDKTDWDFKKVSDNELLSYYNKIDITRKLNEKIAKDNVYSKSEIDNMFAQKIASADTYTQTEVNSKFTSFPGIVDHYTKSQIDSKLAAKIDKSVSYSKKQFDDKAALEEDKTAVYDKTDFDNILNSKIAQTDTYDKTQIWLKFEKIRTNKLKIEKFEIRPGVTNTRVFSDNTHPAGGTSLNNVFDANDALALQNFKFFWGDSLTVEGRVATAHGSQFQGPVFILKEEGSSRQPTIKSIRHWNRWMDTATAQMRTESHQPASSAGTNLPLDDYPLFIAHNLFNDFYEFKLKFIFAENHIFVYAHGILNNQNDVNDTYSVAILNYPPNYDSRKGILLTKIMNVKTEIGTGKKQTTSTSSFKPGSAFVFAGDWDNQVNHLSVPKTTLVKTYQN